MASLVKSLLTDPRVVTSIVVIAGLTVVYRVIKGIRHAANPKHDLPHAQPGRLPPNPAFFPNFFMNRKHIWLHWRFWEAKSVAAKGVILMLPGIGDHTVRQERAAQRFSKEGYHVIALDHQGQGHSEGDSRHVERFTDYVDDACDLVDWATAADSSAFTAPLLKGLPVFLFGHSMGGLIAAHVAMRRPAFFKGVVLAAPALGVDERVASPNVRRIAKLLSAYLPRMHIPPAKLEGMTRNEQARQWMEQDPLTAAKKNPLTARLGAEIMRAMDEAMAGAATKATFRFLLIHGEQDPATPIGPAREYFNAAPSKQKKMIAYPMLRHDFFFDEEMSEQVFADVLEFFSA